MAPMVGLPKAGRAVGEPCFSSFPNTGISTDITENAAGGLTTSRSLAAAQGKEKNGNEFRERYRELEKPQKRSPNVAICAAFPSTQLKSFFFFFSLLRATAQRRPTEGQEADAEPTLGFGSPPDHRPFSILWSLGVSRENHWGPTLLYLDDLFAPTDETSLPMSTGENQSPKGSSKPPAASEDDARPIGDHEPSEDSEPSPCPDGAGLESSDALAKAISSTLGAVIWDFDRKAENAAKSQDQLSAALDRLTGELDRLLDDAPLPFIAQHVAKISAVRRRISSMNLVLKSIQRRVDNIDRLLSMGTSLGELEAFQPSRYKRKHDFSECYLFKAGGNHRFG
ncbi:hypothetical protein ACLOJK_021423 [Asimina triloba]